MKATLFIFLIILLTSCSSFDSEPLSLKNIQAMNQEISTLQNGTGFEKMVLHIKPSKTNQSLVIWEGEAGGIWADANYLVCEIWHSNDFSAVLNVEFFKKEIRAGSHVAEGGDFPGDASGAPRMAAKIGVLPHLKTKVIFPLEHLNGQEIFLRRFPRQLKGTVLGSRMNPEDISKVSIRFAPFQEPHFLPEFEVSAVYLTRELPEPFPATENPVVDSFGQWTAKNWHGKTAGENDLRNLLESQLENANDSSFPENWSKYGGWKEKRFEATGFFRTHYDGTRWWLADPEGYAFVSVGVDCIRDNTAGVITGQEDLLEWIPDRTDPLYKDAFSDRGDLELLDYYKTNLMRVFGKSWRENWETIASGQIREFRLNTIGNWSDIEFARKARIPYVLPLSGFPSTGVRLFRDFPDVFAAEYKENASRFASQLEAFRGDPYLIGYFLRNEPQWAFGAHDIAFEMFATPQLSESKHMFARWLSTQYSGIQDLNQSWNLELENFEVITNQTFDDYPSEKAKEDFWRFSEILVKQYVDVPCDEVEKVDPDHLNLGMRYAGISSGLLYKAGDRFDVFSVNGYGNPGPPLTDKIARLSGKPVMIGEFHFGATDRGLPATGIQGALTQEERGKAYRYYLEQGLARPELVGIHYFQWLDQPVFGRYDGENYNIGFMDICNRPYKELTEAAVKSHLQMYEVADGKVPPFNKKLERIPSVHY